MANQTVTTVVNYDDPSISGLLNGESITISGGSVTIDADVRWNQQAAVFGAVTLSSTLGGSFLIDGTQIWEVPFSASSGTVPTQLDLGSNGVTGGTSGATGELTRVWATGSLTPAAAGAAMPTTGYIKLRSKTGNFQSGETITLPGGATITASGAGKRSWIHVVGRGTTSSGGSRLTIPRLGRFEASGDWYELGTTDGTDNQTFQYPVADQCPAIWIETAPASGVYEIWLNSGDRWSNGAVATDDKRGMYFGMNAATGVITIAARTGNTAGLKPASGCKVRIPNVIMSQANGTTPDWDANIIPGVTSRYGFATTSAGSLTMDHVSCNWLPTTSAAFEIDISDSGFGGILGAFTNTGTTVTLNNVGVGVVDTVAHIPLSIATSYGGGSLTDVRVVRRIAGANGTGIILTDTADFTLTRCRSDVFGANTTNNPNTSNSLFETVRAINTTLVDCVAIGGIGLDIQPGFGVTCTGFKFASRTIGTTQTSDTFNAISAGAGSTSIFIDGFSNFDSVANVHPYGSVVLLATGVNGCEIRNVGTPAAPYNMGTANACSRLLFASQSRNVVVRRIYTENTRNSPYAGANTVQGFEAYNFWGDADDSQVNANINSTIRGGRYTNSVTGQTAVYGTHWQDAWTSTTGGQIVIACNEPTDQTTNQCSFTLDVANGSGFTSAGNVSMAQLTDTVTWTMPYYALGVTGFSNTAPTITGTNAANHTLEFQYDLNDGNGFNGSWLPLDGTNLSGITVDPAKGIKLKVRATVNTASASNLLTYISIDTTTDAVSQQIEYPLPTTQNIGSVTNIRAGSRIRVFNVTTNTEIVNEIVSGTTFTYLYDEGTDFSDGDLINVRLARCLGATASIGYEGTAVAGSTGWSLFADQSDDEIYNANGIDGTAISEFVFDYPNVQVDINDADGATTIARLYAWWANERTTEQGIRTLIGGLIAEDTANYKIITSRINLKLDNTASTGVIFTGDLRLYRDDGAAPVVSSTSGGGSITLYAGKVYTSVVSTASPVITGDIDDVAGRVWNAPLASYQTVGSTGAALDDAASSSGGATAQEVWEYTTRTLTASSDPSAATIATAVRSELSTELGRIDVAVSTRNATAPDNAGIAAIKAKTDNLPADPASNTQVNTRLASAAYTAPDNATIGTINTKVQTLQNADLSGVATQASVDALGAPLQASNYTAPDNAGIAAIKAKTDNIPSNPASRDHLITVNDGVKKASLLVPHSDDLPA